MLITSVENERVKKYIKLKDKKYRDKNNLFMVEGSHLVIEAYKRGLIEELVLEKDEIFPLDIKNVIYLPMDIIKKISQVETPQTVMALCKKQEESNVLGNKVLLIDNVQDPGNLGTIIRSAVAFNIDTIVLSPNSVDLYNPKTIRATQGMFFHVNIITKELEEVIKELKSNEIPVFGTIVGHGEDIRTLNSKDKEKYALVVGNEGNGVREEITKLCDKNFYIDLNSNVESLNVSIAASILLYELGR